ncbi:MAG: site-specific DNA-methyltransferase, partial [Bacteroidota bacterium]
MPSLNWIGKEAVINHHRQVPYHLLRCDNSLSCGDANSGNLLVEGDNLLALKALLPYYAGQVKCIYIDPPYNTGNEKWKYNDNVNSPEIRRWLGKVVGAEAEDLSRHDKWLCMVYPRLELLKEFLSEDGIIFVSVDDNEVNYLRMVLDEIFGPRNWFANLTRRAMHTVRNSSKDFNLNTDYVLVYARNKQWHGVSRDRYIRVPMDKSGNYPHDDNDGKGPYKLDPLHARNFYTPYEYTFNNGVTWKAPKGRYPAYSENTLAEKESAGEIVFTGAEPKAKRYLKDVQEGRPPDALLSPKDVRFNSNGTTLLRRMLGGGAFTQPKPVELIRYLLTMIRDKNAIVLDSFGGSGTTGHSVLDLNKSDGGNRKFILIEIEKDVCNKVTCKRLKAAIEGYNYEQNGKNVKEEGLGGGFRYCRLDKPLFDETGKIGETVSFGDLAAHVFFTETGMPIPKRTNGASSFIGAANGT